MSFEAESSIAEVSILLGMSVVNLERLMSVSKGVAESIMSCSPIKHFQNVAPFEIPRCLGLFEFTSIGSEIKSMLIPVPEKDIDDVLPR